MSCGAHDPGIDAPHTLARFDSECPNGGCPIDEDDVIYLVEDAWLCERCAWELAGDTGA
jgi:hypothetical protein